MEEEDRNGIPRSTSVSRLSKALSHTHLDLLEQEAAGLGQSTPRVSQSTRKRKLSKSQSLSGSLESLSGLGSEARVLVVNTGGTIGMMYQNEVLAPQANSFVKALRKLPILHDEQYAQQTKLYDFHEFPEITLVLPYLCEDYQVPKFIKYKVFDAKPSSKTLSGLLEWETKNEAVEALTVLNHYQVRAPNGSNPYTLKLCFSTSSHL